MLLLQLPASVPGLVATMVNVCSPVSDVMDLMTVGTTVMSKPVTVSVLILAPLCCKAHACCYLEGRDQQEKSIAKLIIIPVSSVRRWCKSQMVVCTETTWLIILSRIVSNGLWGWTVDQVVS